jgi:hypothetical protein
MYRHCPDDVALADPPTLSVPTFVLRAAQTSRLVTHARRAVLNKEIREHAFVIAAESR